MLSRFYYFFLNCCILLFSFLYIYISLTLEYGRKWKLLICVQFLATPWTIQSTEFFRLEYWSDCFSLLQGNLPNQRLNPGLTQCRWIIDEMNHKESPRNWTRDSCIAGRVFTNWAMREAQSMEEAKINVCCIQYFLYAQKSSNCYPIRREYPTVCAPMDCNLPGSCPWDSPGKRRSRLPCHPQEGCPNPGIKSPSPVSPALQADSLPAECRFFSIHFFKLIYFLLKDNCFTEFCCFLSNLNMNQP